jgi:hypothetical protein
MSARRFVPSVSVQVRSTPQGWIVEGNIVRKDGLYTDRRIVTIQHRVNNRIVYFQSETEAMKKANTLRHMFEKMAQGLVVRHD